MNPDCPSFYPLHRLDEAATHPSVLLAGRLAALLLQSQTVVLGAPGRLFLAGGYPAASSRLAIRPASSTLGRVQLPFLG